MQHVGYLDVLHSALAEAAGGAAAGVVADSVLYAIDSAKVRSQSKPVAGGSFILFRGLVPTVLLGSVPVFGTFFLLYAPLRDSLNASDRRHLLPFASAACAIPAGIVGVPADVLKKRLVLGMDENISSALSHIKHSNGGWKGLFAGWHVNLIRDLPFAAVKIGLYEAFVNEYQQFYKIEHISPVGASLCGVSSGVCCAIVTCPLDVVNTRIKAGATSSQSIVRVATSIVQTEGVVALFRGVAMRSVVVGLGSSIFWPIQRMVSQHLGSDESFMIWDRLTEL